MFSNAAGDSPNRTRAQAAEEVNFALTRFSLVLQILGELGEAEVPFPGDDDIRRGCERSLTAMLVALARIEPAPADGSHVVPGPSVPMLHGKEAADLVNSDQLQRMDQFVERIFGPSGHH